MGTSTTSTLRRALYVAENYAHVFETHGAYSVTATDYDGIRVQGKSRDGVEKIAATLLLPRNPAHDSTAPRAVYEHWTGTVDGVAIEVIGVRNAVGHHFDTITLANGPECLDCGTYQHALQNPNDALCGVNDALLIEALAQPVTA